MALDGYRDKNPIVNCTCRGPRLHVPYENLMPADLKGIWGGDSAGDQQQIQIIISSEV